MVVLLSPVPPGGQARPRQELHRLTLFVVLGPLLRRGRKPIKDPTRCRVEEGYEGRRWRTLALGLSSECAISLQNARKASVRMRMMASRPTRTKDPRTAIYSALNGEKNKS